MAEGSGATCSECVSNKQTSIQLRSDREEVITALSGTQKERRRVFGLASLGGGARAVMEIFKTDAEGKLTWTLLITMLDGCTCKMMVGTTLEFIDEALSLESNLT